MVYIFRECLRTADLLKKESLCLLLHYIFDKLIFGNFERLHSLNSCANMMYA